MLDRLKTKIDETSQRISANRRNLLAEASTLALDVHDELMSYIRELEARNKQLEDEVKTLREQVAIGKVTENTLRAEILREKFPMKSRRRR